MVEKLNNFLPNVKAVPQHQELKLPELKLPKLKKIKA